MTGIQTAWSQFVVSLTSNIFGAISGKKGEKRAHKREAV